MKHIGAGGLTPILVALFVFALCVVVLIVTALT